MKDELRKKHMELLKASEELGLRLPENMYDFEWYLIETIKEQQKEFERYKKYVMYFAGKDKVNDIRMAMEGNELN